MTDMEMQITISEAEELTRLLSQFVSDYGQKPADQTDAEWLKMRLLAELPELGEAAAGALGRETVETVAAYNQSYASMLEAKAQGRTAPEWFAAQVQRNTAISPDELNTQLGTLHTVLEQANRQMQQQLDPGSALPQETWESVDWSACNTGMLAKSVGQQAILAGVQSAAVTAGYDLADKLIAAEPINTEAVVTSALETGMDAGLKIAASGALKVATEKNLIQNIPAGTPARILADLVCTEVENIRILGAVTDGTITPGEAVDQMGRSSAVMYYEMSFSTAGSAIGAAALSWIPVVGPVVGKVVGGAIGHMAGTKVGQAVHTAAHKVASTAKKAAKAVWNGAKAAVSKAASSIRSGLRKLFH